MNNNFFNFFKSLKSVVSPELLIKGLWMDELIEPNSYLFVFKDLLFLIFSTNCYLRVYQHGLLFDYKGGKLIYE